MSTDVTINGVGYMVHPGSYQADNTTITEVTDGTAAIAAELPTSQRKGRAIATSFATRGAIVGGVGGLLPHVGPNWRPPFPIGKLGIGPPPIAETRSGTIDSSGPRLGIAAQDYGFLIANDDLERWTATSITTRKATMGAAGAGLAVRGDRDIFVAFGASQDVARWEDDSSTWTTSVFGAGEKASLIAMLADRPVVVKPTEPGTVYVWTATFSSAPSFETNGNVLAMLPVQNGLLVATDQSWYVLSETDGAPGSIAPTMRPTRNATDVYLEIHDGRTSASVDGSLFRRSPLTGGWTRVDAPGDVAGIVSNGQWLFAEVTTQYGASGIWALADDAWFYVNTSLDQVFPGPGRLIGGTVDAATDFYWLDDSDPDDSSNYATSYQVATALQGATIARDKNWTQIGAEFHRPDSETVGTWTAQLQYSTNAGRTWSNAGSSQNITDEHQRITATIDVDCRVLMVRVNMAQTTTLAPIVVALWADWQVTSTDGGDDPTAATADTRTPTNYRRWRFKILAQDDVIDREGALIAIDASTIRSNLWARLNQTSSFTDLDGTVHATTTITDIDEKWPMPSDEPHTVSTELTLTILEGDHTIA